ncbi:fungal chitosanase of glycosyl hydrolase group 75-domain-containing protein [Aspergillus spinulosporus]
MSSNRHFRFITAFFFAVSVLCHFIDGSDNDHPDEIPPASYFSAVPTMPVAALQSAASRLGRTSHGGSFRVSSDSGERSSIYSDWASFNEGAAVVWTADMDVDCDGIDYGCKGNSDGRPETSWGALSAYEVPFIVIPEHYLDKHKTGLPGNNIAAVICNGNMFYGILGDTNGDSPESLKAFVLTAILDIVFLGEDAVLPASAMNDRYITDFDTLRAKGDALVNALASNIGLGSGDGMRPLTRFRHPLFRAADAATGVRRTAAILTARSLNTTSRSLEPSTASYRPTSGSSTPPRPTITSVSTPVTLSPSASSPLAANPSASNAANSAGSSTSPSNTAPGDPCSTLDDCSNDLVCINGLCAVDQDVVLDSTSSSTGTPAVRRWITAIRHVEFGD